MLQTELGRLQIRELESRFQSDYRTQTASAARRSAQSTSRCSAQGPRGAAGAPTDRSQGRSTHDGTAEKRAAKGYRRSAGSCSRRLVGKSMKDA